MSIIDTSKLKAFEDPIGRVHIAYDAEQLSRSAGDGHYRAEDYAELDRSVVFISASGKKIHIGEELDRVERTLTREPGDDPLATKMVDALWTIDP